MPTNNSKVWIGKMKTKTYFVLFFQKLSISNFQYKKITWGKNTFFCKNVLLYTINFLSILLKIIIIKFSCILKIVSRNTFLNLNLTVLPILLELLRAATNYSMVLRSLPLSLIRAIYPLSPHKTDRVAKILRPSP